MADLYKKVLCIITAVFILTLCGCSNEKRPVETTDEPLTTTVPSTTVDESTTATPSQTTVLPTSYPETTGEPVKPSNPYAELSPAELISRLSFFGDSTTSGLIKYSSSLKYPIIPSAVWHGADATVALCYLTGTTKICVHANDKCGIYEANTPSDEYLSLSSALSSVNPEILIVTLGFSGGAAVSTVNEQDMRGYYSDLITLVRTYSPETILVFQTIFPIASTYTHTKMTTSEVRARVENINRWLKSIAVENAVPCIDSYSVFIDSDGYMKAEYSSDGSHLNAAGLSAELEFIAEKLPSLLENQ